MKFFICKDKSKFTKQQHVENYGDWYFIRDDKVEIWKFADHIVLYCGYLIEGDIEEVCSNFSFREANGNFFAVKLTTNDYDLSVDYFQNHKLFRSEKYGIEITNHLPYMTIKEADLVGEDLYLDRHGQEHSNAECTTFYDHVVIFNPLYNYRQDAKDAFAQEVWQDVEGLTEYIHQCMKDHSEVIKEKYPLRYCSLSDGLDSALQSLFFREDLQLLYSLDACKSKNQHEYLKRAQSNFPNTHHYTFLSKDNYQECLNHLVDSSCRQQACIPTYKHLKMQERLPDILMYGSNGNEMFVRDLLHHVLVLILKYYSYNTKHMEDMVKMDICSKSDMYGSAYWNDDKNAEEVFHKYIDEVICRLRDVPHKWIVDTLMRVCSPRLYNRAISANMDIMSSSIYNDRRIFHEFMKGRNDWLQTNAMDAPVQMAILDMYGYNFTTPRRCNSSSEDKLLYTTSQEATVESDMRQNI